MKRLSLILFSCFVSLFVFADVTIDKERCTLTKDGKTFPLYGNIKIVDDNPDITVRLVDGYADIEVKIVEQYPSCCEFRIVDDYPDIRVKIVDDTPDIEVKVVDSYPSIRQTSKSTDK